MNSDASPVALGVLFAVTVVVVGLGLRRVTGILLARRFDARLFDRSVTWKAHVPWRRVLMIGIPAIAVLAVAAAVAPALVGGSDSHATAADPPAHAAGSDVSVSRATVSHAPVIRVAHGSTLTRLGAWSLRDRSLGAVTAAFGHPSSKRVGRGCIATWAHVALTVTSTSGACKATAVVSTVTVGGMWRTWAGLRVGDPVSEIRVRHPHATAHATAWWLPTASVAAIVRRGRVAAFRLALSR